MNMPALNFTNLVDITNAYLELAKQNKLLKEALNESSIQIKQLIDYINQNSKEPKPL
jgi:hypothetical protein